MCSDPAYNFFVSVFTWHHVALAVLFFSGWFCGVLYFICYQRRRLTDYQWERLQAWLEYGEQHQPRRRANGV